jgi:RimJ/RimL family protein N-acetyltransferase
MAGLELATLRLRLRPFEAGDAGLLVELDRDPEVMRWINGGRAVPEEEVVKASVPRVMAQTDALRGVGFWTARDGASDERLGWFHIKPPRVPPGMTAAEWKLAPGEQEIGWRLVRRVWGRGLATEGARALIGFAFASLGASRVIACAMSGNTASRRVMEKVGMRYDGEFVEDRWPLEDKGAVRYAIARQS